MSITTVGTALREVVAAAISARASFDDTPTGRPTMFPATVVIWAKSETNARLNLGHAANDKWFRTAVRNLHTFQVFALLSTTQHTGAEGAAGRVAAQAILDALNTDATLRGSGGVDRCASARLVSIEPYRETVDDTTVIAGLAAVVAVEEAT